ncbi:BH3-interacting domain death agonist [Eublepharis macularius]|uniref:BH3-interacting domain death agonist n=1 Tax=Eublepharis macularius TaxID=481883 RepID=A0AA97L6N7_EUBMA|nr:BH3-interacting domain death agonist [Eublepharis macularius]XP_054843750.1 BH3-interacting domain death agonist [Eublepharis macularius]XP_054843751.1 BH3-interacting domain death agonist [Eublepharis macularius]
MNQGFGGNNLVEYTIPSVLLYSFLENCSNCTFLPELHALGKQLKASKPCLRFEGAFDGDLQTDGNRVGRFQVTEPGVGNDEEIFRIIGAQLAEIGDKLVVEMEPPLMNGLVQQFMAENFSREEITRHLSQAVEALARRMPVEMEQERAMLFAAMLLARNVANTVPSLLHRVFVTTVNYINYRLQDFVNNLAPEG